jgi:hypothetical protein
MSTRSRRNHLWPRYPTFFPGCAFRIIGLLCLLLSFVFVLLGVFDRNSSNFVKASRIFASVVTAAWGVGFLICFRYRMIVYIAMVGLGIGMIWLGVALIIGEGNWGAGLAFTILGLLVLVDYLFVKDREPP